MDGMFSRTDNALLTERPGSWIEAFLSSELIATLDHIAVPASLPRGAILFRSGDPVSAVFIIRKGLVTLEWPVNRCSMHFELVGPGQIIGLPAALNGIYSVTARIAEDTELGYILSSWVTELLEGDARLCLAATKLVSAEVARVRSVLATESDA